METNTQKRSYREFIQISVGGTTRYVALEVRTETVVRLGKTAFRGKGIAKAGNFSRWSSVSELLRDLRSEFESYAEEVVGAVMEHERSKGLHKCSTSDSFDLPYDHIVGWSSTDNVEKYDRWELELFHPNSASKALRVRKGSNRFAPRTRFITFKTEIRHEISDGRWRIVIHSIYPGEDVGRLKGDVTQRLQEVFFDWEHPGEPAEFQASSLQSAVSG
jgi:hypothetical protein